MSLLDTLAKVGFDWRLALTNLVNFGLIVWLLAKFLWPSIAKAINERQRIIDQGLDDAEAAKEHLAKGQADYQAKLVEANREAKEIVRQADERGQQIKTVAQTEAQKEAEALKQRVASELNQEKEQMTAAVRQESAQLVAAAMEKVLQEKLDSAADEKMIKQAIESLHG
ncbi:MAG TPA: F0F1 ATP synthase subunit B [bacterium]|nr:F0F1 ATP synthase subunit B [bacterium]